MLKTSESAAEDGARPRRRGAIYVRMSTDLQNFSIQHQSDKIYGYAAAHDIDIVKMYADEGKSGLNLRDRSGLARMLTDVQAETPGFSVILVYDVSRWGRFQDVDESAYYDHVCRRAGIEVIYCAEQFDNDGSTVSAILKNLKRAMAAEYSRELSVKVFEAQCSFIRMGYRQGGSAGYGFRRVSLSDESHLGQPLELGQRKINLTDRVRLILGPANEIAVIRKIYEWYLQDGLTEKEIAEKLNVLEVLSETGKPWTRWRVLGILTNEKYIGSLLFNRKSAKLKKRSTDNPTDIWIRMPGAFSSIISLATFKAVAEEHARRAHVNTDMEMLVMLRELYDQVGPVSAGVLREHKGIPGHKAYIGRFGSLARAYELAGVPISSTVAQRVASKKRLAIIRQGLIDDTIAHMRRAGAAVSIAGQSSLLVVNRSIVVKVVISRAQYDERRRLRWKISLTAAIRPEFIVAILLDRENTQATSFYLLPESRFYQDVLTLKEEQAGALDDYRHPDLASIFGQTSSN